MPHLAVIVVTQLTTGFVQAPVCVCGWAVCRLHANTLLMHAMHAMLRPVWGQSGLRSISHMALKGACRNRTRRSPSHARIAELQTNWRNHPMISSLRCVITLQTTNEGLKHQVMSLCSTWATKSTTFEHFEFCHFRHGIRLIQAKIRLQRIHPPKVPRARLLALRARAIFA